MESIDRTIKTTIPGFIEIFNRSQVMRILRRRDELHDEQKESLRKERNIYAILMAVAMGAFGALLMIQS